MQADAFEVIQSRPVAVTVPQEIAYRVCLTNLGLRWDDVVGGYRAAVAAGW